MEYKLGKLPAKYDYRTLPLKLILKKLPTIPSEFNVDSQYSGIYDNFMFKNDQYGDCVIASRAHQTLRFEFKEQKAQIQIPDNDVVREYLLESGGADSGLVMLDSLNHWRKDGWTINGQPYCIYAFAKVTYLHHDDVMAGVYLLDGLYAGFLVPASCLTQFRDGQVWDIVENDGGIIGGHAIYIVGYNCIGPICMTWGRRQQMTWAFWDKYVDEAFAIVDNKDAFLRNSPLDIKLLSSYLNEVADLPAEPPKPKCNFFNLFHLYKHIKVNLEV
jgi:hypothetical protein